jgi:glucose/arabinose dehydrogenase
VNFALHNVIDGMINCISRFPLLPVVLLAVSGVPISAQTPSISAGPQILDVQGGKIRVVPVATGLYHHWSLAFPDARTILVAERNGKLRMIRDSVLLRTASLSARSPRRN